MLKRPLVIVITDALRARFNAKVLRADGDKCWEWQGSRTKRGYGKFKIPNGKQSGRLVSAHRVAWVLEYGPIPEGEGHHGTCVLHKCDHPPCCRPCHLFLGSNKNNQEDRVKKGRFIGENAPSAKLTDAQVREIRSKFQGSTGPALAAEYGVTDGQIYNLAYGTARISAGGLLTSTRRQAHRVPRKLADALPVPMAS